MTTVTMIPGVTVANPGIATTLQTFNVTVTAPQGAYIVGRWDIQGSNDQFSWDSVGGIEVRGTTQASGSWSDDGTDFAFYRMVQVVLQPVGATVAANVVY